MTQEDVISASSSLTWEQLVDRVASEHQRGHCEEAKPTRQSTAPDQDRHAASKAAMTRL
jgi:hypothetical protein